MSVTVNTEIGGAAIGGQSGGGGDVESVNGQTGVVELDAGDVGAAAASFTTIAVSGQSNVVADTTADTLTLAAGSNIAITTNATTDTVTVAATGLPTASFTTIAVSGQSDVVADSAADTLTLAAGTGITITTDASTDTVTVTGTPAPTSGTFTPTLVSSGGGTPVYTSQIGRHCDVGNRCFFEARIILTNLGTLAAGNLTIEGMPHTAANITNNITSVSIYATNAQATAVQQLMAGVVPNTATVRLVRYSAGALALMTVADINTTFAVSISGSFEY
jgi:hypothetical protein